MPRDSYSFLANIFNFQHFLQPFCKHILFKVFYKLVASKHAYDPAMFLQTPPPLYKHQIFLQCNTTVVYPIRNGHFKMADCTSSKR